MVGINNNDPFHTLDIGGTIAIRDMNGITSAALVRVWGDELFYDTSSLRAMEDVQPLRGDFGGILDVEPKSFIDKTTGQRNIGYVAEEIDELGLTDLVIYNEKGRPDALRHDLISLYLVEVLKDLRAENEELKDRMETLETAVQVMTEEVYGLNM